MLHVVLYFIGEVHHSTDQSTGRMFLGFSIFTLTALHKMVIIDVQNGTIEELTPEEKWKRKYRKVSQSWIVMAIILKNNKNVEELTHLLYFKCFHPL